MAERSIINMKVRSAHEQTRLEQTEQIFRLLVESVKDYAIFLLDTEGRIASWNEGAERIKGYTDEEIIGQHFSIFYLKEARESKWPDRELQIAAKEGRFADEGLRLRKDGSTFWASVVITALRDAKGELLGFSKVTRDLTDRQELEEQTRELNRQLHVRLRDLLESQRVVESRTLALQKLSSELLRVQDEERRKLARTLHDDLGQEMAALKLELESTRNMQSDDNHLRHALAITDGAIHKMRHLSYLLHPPLLDEAGLLPALHWYIDGLQSRGQLQIAFDYRPVPFRRLARDIEITVFRIVQESLTNIYRHSASQDARIELTQEGGYVRVRVRDYGKGMPDELSVVRGVGISGMTERVKQLGGEFNVSRAEPGTLVQATIPLVERPFRQLV
jgi:PAS domain S-box-containing protein